MLILKKYKSASIKIYMAQDGYSGKRKSKKEGRLKRSFRVYKKGGKFRTGLDK